MVVLKICAVSDPDGKVLVAKVTTRVIADRLGMKQSAVSNWRKNGVPWTRRRQAAAIAAMSGIAPAPDYQLDRPVGGYGVGSPPVSTMLNKGCPIGSSESSSIFLGEVEP